MKIDEFEEMANTEEANLTLLLEKIDQEQNAKLQVSICFILILISIKNKREYIYSNNYYARV